MKSEQLKIFFTFSNSLCKKVNALHIQYSCLFIQTHTFGTVQERNAGMSVGMQSKITGGRETCGNVNSLA